MHDDQTYQSDKPDSITLDPILFSKARMSLQQGLRGSFQNFNTVGSILQKLK